MTYIKEYNEESPFITRKAIKRSHFYLAFSSSPSLSFPPFKQLRGTQSQVRSEDLWLPHRGEALYESAQLVLVNSGKASDSDRYYCGLTGYADRIPNLVYGYRPKEQRRIPYRLPQFSIYVISFY
jgi:hypothetical protein